MPSPITLAKFICNSDPKENACYDFKKCFTVKGSIVSATLLVSALGVFVPYLNGARIGDDCMAPGWTNYKKRLQYLEYDVVDIIKDENELVIGVGGGWFSAFPEYRRYGSHAALIAALKIVYSDGTNELITTDESWLVSESHVKSSTIYDGETVDARVVPDFCKRAAIFDYDRSVLIPFEGERVKEIERIAAKELIVTPAGEQVLDFGQEITGIFEFRIENARGGETVSIECAEILDSSGNFYRENYRSAKARLDYTARAGAQSYKASYTFFGFRYLRLTNWCEPIRPENFTAIVIHSDMRRTGFFECGHKKLCRLYSNVIWGQRDNFLDVPTDCPQRDEKLGWTGDAQVFARTASINYDTERFFAKWLGDMMSEQREDGGIPFVIPDVEGYDRSNSSAWSDASCIVPWELYRAFGSKELLRRHIPMMKGWVDFVRSRAGEKCIWSLDGERQFGDWLALDAPKGSYTGSTDKTLIATAFFYHSTKILEEALKTLDFDASEYTSLAEMIKKAYLNTFIKDGALTSDTQTAHVLTLHFGLAEGDPVLKKRLATRLTELVTERGDALCTGFVGTPYLLDTLTEIGRADKAYRLLLREEFPSWLYSVNRGATTVWEHWDGVDKDGKLWSSDMNSFNHYAYGSVASWLYETVCGIKPTSPAYKSVMLSPIPSRELGYACARINTRSGSIFSAWKYEGDTVKYTFTVPHGISAECSLPLGTKKALIAGTHVLYEGAPDQQ